MIYEFIGKVSVIAVLGLLILILISIGLGILLVKKGKLVLPNVLLFTVDTFYLQVKRVAGLFGLSDNIVDQMGIEVRNSLGLQEFSGIPASDRIMVVPQCLRHIKCPARLDSSIGVACKECGLCIIKDLKIEAERLGYTFFIVPGGSFVERIVKEVRPKAALGVACFKDLNIAMYGLSKFKCIVQGVALTKDGCVETEVNPTDVLKKMRVGIERIEEEMGKGCIIDAKPADN
jgi:hypothetical protein